MTAATVFNALFSLIHLGAITGLILLLARPALRARFERRCVGSATAVDLAWIRIVTCLVLAAYVLTEDLSSQAHFGPDWFKPPGYLVWLGRDPFDWLLADALRLRVLTWLVLAALLLGAAGCLTRVSLPVAALLYLLFAGLLRSFGKYFHEGYLGFYVLVALCFLPCADAWSIDARWRRERGAASYAWAAWACYAALALPYIQLGLSKLASGGIFWFDGRSLRNYMLADNLNLTRHEIDLALRFYDAPTILFTIAGAFALATELAYALVLVVPRLRLVLPACVALLHVGVLLGQDALFFDACLMPLIFFQPGRRSWGRA